MSNQDSNAASSGDGRDGDTTEPASTRSQANSTTDGSETIGDPAAPQTPQTMDEQLDAARKQAAEHYDRFVRAKADIENMLKRHQRELADRSRYDGETLARDILQSIDDLERALEHAGDAGSSVTDGIELVRKGLLTALQRNGVERIEAEGKPFDPAEHEAVTVVQTRDVPPNTVTAVFRAGYKIRDRLLRPAMVSVSKAPDPES